MKVELYTIETLTNLHVGSGDLNFNIVDNQVQKDAISELPNINSSSLKGAFREYFENKNGMKKLVEYVFGGQNNKNEETRQGAYSFFEAQLLTRPVRSNKKAYFNAISPGVIKGFLEIIDNFDIKIDERLKNELIEFSTIEVNNNPLIFENIDGVFLEDDEAQYYDNFNTSIIETFLGTDLALFSDEEFKKLSLPVIARNHLDNGVSKNLWYEEVVPKKSKFYFFIGKPENIAEKDKREIEEFEKTFDEKGGRLQIGANKTIGYGFTIIKKVSE
jgi:CRISPR-associated protein Cmr4